MQRIEPVQLGGAKQGLNGRGAPAGAFGAGEEPILLADGDGAYRVLDRVVVCALLRHD